jgi:hypothetical protein
MVSSTQLLAAGSGLYVTLLCWISSRREMIDKWHDEAMHVWARMTEQTDSSRSVNVRAMINLACTGMDPL